ncbi:MAG TPA: hypothetical protein PK156_50260 [Polyangium sp.]|nr:hypothetical protein [Polyangium sp.]
MGGGDKLRERPLSTRLALGFVVLLIGFVVPGCVRDVSEDDCRALGKHLHDIWTEEAKFPEKPSASAERAVAVIRNEGDKLEQSVIASCKRDHLGKPKASGEFSCLSRAKTYADVQTCATIPVH